MANSTQARDWSWWTNSKREFAADSYLNLFTVIVIFISLFRMLPLRRFCSEVYRCSMSALQDLLVGTTKSSEKLNDRMDAMEKRPKGKGDDTGKAQGKGKKGKKRVASMPPPAWASGT